APAVSPTCAELNPSPVGNMSTLASEPTSVTSSPSMIQLVPSAAIISVWKRDQRNPSSRAGMSVANGPLVLRPIGFETVVGITFAARFEIYELEYQASADGTIIGASRSRRVAPVGVVTAPI